MAVQRKGQHDMNLVADSIQDLLTMPVASMGSTVYVIETAEKYMANSKGQWVRQTMSTNNNGVDAIIDPAKFEALAANVDVLNEVSSWSNLDQ